MKNNALHALELRKASKAHAATFFDVSIPVIEKWLREGMPYLKRGSRGQNWEIDLLAAAKWRFQPRLDDGSVDPDSLTPIERKHWYDAEKRRRELQVMDRELIPRAEVEEVIATGFANVAQTLLALPDNLERMTGISTDQVEQTEALIHEAMEALADKLAVLGAVDSEEEIANAG